MVPKHKRKQHLFLNKVLRSKEFQDFVLKYDNPKLSELVKPSLEKDLKIPPYLLSKFYFRLYGIECNPQNFYTVLNLY